MRVLLVEEDLIAARGITLMLKAAGAVRGPDRQR